MTSLTDKYYSLESEDDFRSGFWNISHQQQFFSALPSPKWSHNTNYWYSWVQTIFYETHLLNVWCLLANQALEQRISWCQPSMTICICLNQCIYGWWVFSQHWTWGCLVWGNGNHRQKKLFCYGENGETPVAHIHVHWQKHVDHKSHVFA